MSYLRKFKSELKKIQTPDKAKVLGAAYEEEKTAPKANSKVRRAALTPLVAMILCIAMIGGAAAAIPAIVRYVNARILTDNGGRLDTVPEGYIGIYSATDLDAIRNDLDANYILMSDLDLSGSIFAPIGRGTDGIFSGIFNGNGYAIKNLKLDTSAVKDGYFGLFGNTNGYFINLSIEGLTLDVVLDEPQTDICIGTIAGSATFVGGCYIKDCKISVTCEELGEKGLYVGGIAGTSDYIDSCAIYADVSVSGKGGKVYAALGTASTFSAVTTYTVGKINVSDEEFTSLLTADVALTFTDASMPVMLSETAMQKITQKLEDHYGDDRFYVNKLKSFFIPVDKSVGIQYDKFIEANELFGYLYPDELADKETVYLFEARARLDEVETVSRALSTVFGSHEEFLSFCNENHIKCGMISCYSFESTESLTANALAGFDFENIWAQGDRIIPRIFVE